MAPAKEDDKSRDPRMDRLVSWVLTTVAGLAFSVGAWAFNDQRTEFRAMREEVVKMTTRLAVLEGISSDLPVRVRAVEAEMAARNARLTALERDVELLKTKKP